MEYNLFDDNFNSSIICGTDEAGRGPLAGPVVVASVVLSSSFPFSILNDSKKMSEKKRIEAEKIIKEEALFYSIKIIENTTIDKINILNASLLGMRESSIEIYKKYPFDLLLCDGNKTPDVPFATYAIIKGDSKIPQIMAASILAKNERDRIMNEYSTIYPQYHFDKHKGYPTKEHYLSIEKFGPCPIHRLSFKLYKNKEETQRDLFN